MLLPPSLHLETDFQGRFALARRWPDGSGGAVVITAHDVDPPWIVGVSGVVPGVADLSDDSRKDWQRDEEANCYLKAFQALPDAFAVAFALLRLDAAERCRVLVQLGRADLAPEGRERAAVAEILAEQAARLDAFTTETAAMETNEDGAPFEVVSLLCPMDPDDPFYADAAALPNLSEALTGDALHEARIRALKFDALQLLRSRGSGQPAPAGVSKEDRAAALKHARQRRRAAFAAAAEPRPR